MLIIASRMVGQWFNLGTGVQSADSYADGSPLDRNIFLALILAALIVVVKRRKRVGSLIQNNRWLCLYLVYCGISIAWSDFPVVSLKRYVKEIGNLLMVMIVWTEATPIEAVKVLMKRCAYVLVPMSIIMFKYYPEFGRSYSRWTGDLSFTGVTNNKNSLGALCAISGIGLAWSLLSEQGRWRAALRKKRAWVQGGMLLMTVWVLVESHSATSLACFVLGVCILIATRVNAIRRNIGVYVVTAIVTVSAMLLMGNGLSVTTGMLGRDETLTGRTDVWHAAIGLGTNPVIGDGYSSFWLGQRMERMWEMFSWHPTEVHDGYLDIYLDLGIIGLIILAALLSSSLVSAIKMVRSDFEQGVLRLAVVTVAILYNITESSFRPGLLVYFALILVVFRIPASVRPGPRGLQVSSAEPVAVTSPDRVIQKFDIPSVTRPLRVGDHLLTSSSRLNVM
jgi:exopolysaccharide production protein ExoQ